jgi:hypothetical protein
MASGLAGISCREDGDRDLADSLSVQIDDHHGGGLAVHSAVAIAVAAWFSV